MEDVLNVPVFLSTLRENDKYREEFISIAPEVKADVVSFQGNPNCGCRRKIADYVGKNVKTEPVSTFLTTWKQQYPNLFMTATANQTVQSTGNRNMTVQAAPDTTPQMMPPPAPPVNPNGPMHAKNAKSMSGHVVEIPADPIEYKTLLDHAMKERWFYRGLTVLSKDDKWLVFFY